MTDRGTKEMKTEVYKKENRGDNRDCIIFPDRFEEIDVDRYRVLGIDNWKSINWMFDDEQLAGCALRIDYMYKKQVTTSILMNFKDESVFIHNYSDNIMLRAFGINRKPDWDELQYFLEERCLPRTRDGIKRTLGKMGLQCYEPLQICEKTGGRIMGDDMHMRFYYFRLAT